MVLLIRNMKAAWRQKQYRDGLAERKAYSFTLDVRVKQQLDYLARKQGKTISETLEGLIKKAGLKAEKANAKDRLENPVRLVVHRSNALGLLDPLSENSASNYSKLYSKEFIN